MSLLTDEEISQTRRVTYGTTFEADVIEVSFARAIEAAVIKKLLEQEPVATVVDSDSTESVINQAIPVGTDLYLHPAPQSEWQPIETAPKNEVEILVLAPIIGQMVVMFADGYWREKANYLGLKHAPTHWQPQPQPPEAK